MFAPNRILKTAARDFLKDLDLTGDELLYLLDLAAEVKASPADYAHSLDGKNVGMLFEKPSLRTQAPLGARHEADGRRKRLPRRPHRRPRAPERCRPQPRPLGQWTRRPRLPPEHRRWPRPLVARPRHQRPQRPLPSLPGPRRFSDHPRTLRRLAAPRAQAYLHRRRQQRRPVAHVDRTPPRYGFRPRLPRGLPA